MYTVLMLIYKQIATFRYSQLHGLTNTCNFIVYRYISNIVINKLEIISQESIHLIVFESIIKLNVITKCST